MKIQTLCMNYSKTPSKSKCAVTQPNRNLTRTEVWASSNSTGNKNRLNGSKNLKRPVTTMISLKSKLRESDPNQPT